jgi:hypothetical protein
MQSMHSFLDNRSEDWRECLKESLTFLRDSWDTQWVGLPLLVDACADFLKLNATEPTEITAKLLAVAREVADEIEAASANNSLYVEPRYHNRLHFADVLATVTLQSAIESQQSNASDPPWQAALILVAIAHDLRHPGRVNHHRSEIEQLSVNALRPYLQAHAVPDLWSKRIERIIVSSDFSLVSENHQRIAGKAFSWDTDWAIVLINEADVMASVLEEFGRELGVALANEWALAGLPMHNSVATNQGRLDFLRSTMFSSYSATILGARTERLKQLAGHRK